MIVAVINETFIVELDYNFFIYVLRSTFDSRRVLKDWRRGILITEMALEMFILSH